MLSEPMQLEFSPVGSGSRLVGFASLMLSLYSPSCHCVLLSSFFISLARALQSLVAAMLLAGYLNRNKTAAFLQAGEPKENKLGGSE